MPSVGDTLRQARESQGRSISQVAAQTRIDSRYLEAVEAGDLSRLPGGFFARSFVRQYADSVEVPFEQIREELDQWLASAPSEEPDLTPKIMVTGLTPLSHMLEGGRKPRRKMFGAAATLVLAIGACAGLYSLWLRSETAAGLPILPKQSAAPVVVAPPPATPEPLATVPAASLVEEEPVESGEAATLSTDLSETSPAEPAVQPPQGPLWFELAARAETWVRVQTGGRTLFMGILEPGESRRFDGLQAATIRTGNAGGLDLSVNGKSAGPVGPVGQIRIITLTPEQTLVEAPPRRPATAGEAQEEGGVGNGDLQ